MEAPTSLTVYQKIAERVQLSRTCLGSFEFAVTRLFLSLGGGLGGGHALNMTWSSCSVFEQTSTCAILRELASLFHVLLCTWRSFYGQGFGV